MFISSYSGLLQRSVKMASQQQQPQPGGPMAQPGLQQSSTLQQLSQQQDFDPVHRFKMLIPQLKESLQVNVPTAKVAWDDTGAPLTILPL